MSYVESYRGQVLASECNFLGHMNIQFYAARVSHALWNMSYILGIPPEDIKSGKRAFVTVQQESSHQTEVQAGDILHMESAVLECSNRSLTLQHRLINSATGEVTMVNVMTLAHMDLETRKAIPFPLPMKEKIAELMAEKEGAK